MFMGGNSPTMLDVIEYFTIASTSDTTDFGNLSAARANPCSSSMSSDTRGIIAGGASPSAPINIIEYITNASTGDAADFGDLTATRTLTAGCSDVHGGL